MGKTYSSLSDALVGLVDESDQTAVLTFRGGPAVDTVMITSLQNETLKRIRRLRRCKGEHALLEGPNLLGEALDGGQLPETVLMTLELAETPEGAQLAARLAAPPRLVAEQVLERVMDADSPRGVLAVVKLPRGGIQVLPQVDAGVYVYVDGLQDPGNLGALARVAEAAGAQGLALAAGCVHPNHPRALRASAGSLLRLPVALGVGVKELDAHLQTSGSESARWLALEPRDGVSLYQAPLEAGTLVLALGAEGPGLSVEVRRRADVHLTIPMVAPVESLNAVVAAALVLFEARRQRSAVLSARDC